MYKLSTIVVVAVLVLTAAVLLVPVQAADEGDSAVGPDLLMRIPCAADHDPFNPDDIVATLDAGALSCTGLPRNC